MTKESAKIKSRVYATVKYDDGHEETIEQGHNLITTAGFNMLIQSLINTSNRPAVLGYIAIGTGTTAASATQTSLVTENKRKAGTWSWTSGSDTFTISTTWDRGQVTAKITEGGVFNASSGGTMFDRIVFETPFQGASDIQYTQHFEFQVL